MYVGCIVMIFYSCEMKWNRFEIHCREKVAIDKTKLTSLKRVYSELTFTDQCMGTDDCVKLVYV